MRQLEAVIYNVVGLHARPARVLVDTAKKFQANISVQHGSKQADAKNLISILTLGVATGQKVQFQVEGADEDAATTALIVAIVEGLGDGPPSSILIATLQGGLGEGLVNLKLDGSEILARDCSPEIDQEQVRLQKALAAARDQLSSVTDHFQKNRKKWEH
jgi:phosphotransferase system HPr (HPr) family protein